MAACSAQESGLRSSMWTSFSSRGPPPRRWRARRSANGLGRSSERAEGQRIRNCRLRRRHAVPQATTALRDRVVSSVPRTALFRGLRNRAVRARDARLSRALKKPAPRRPTRPRSPSALWSKPPPRRLWSVPEPERPPDRPGPALARDAVALAQSRVRRAPATPPRVSPREHRPRSRKPRRGDHRGFQLTAWLRDP